MYSLGYILDVQICIAVLYLVYITLLHKHISYNSARIYLLLMLPVGLLIPLLDLPLLPAVESVFPVVNEVSNLSLPELVAIEEVRQINLYYLAYFIGLGLMLSWLVVGFVRLFALFRVSRVEWIEGSKVVFVGQKSYAYTVLNLIFINKKFKDSPMLSELIAHEMEHIKLGHTYDLLYISVMRIIFWFNPMVWHVQHLLRQIHEYQVDRSVIEKGYSLKSYVNLLIMSEAGISPEFTTPFGYSFTKKRIAMLIKKNPANNCGRLLVTVPVLASLLFAFSVTSQAAGESVVIGQKRDSVLHLKGKKPLEVVKELQGSQDALFVVDGVVSSKEIVSALDMNNIKRVTVLKDKAAIDIYGDAAKNGVVIIEMKEVPVVNVKGGSASKVDLQGKDMLIIIDGIEVKYEDFAKLPTGNIKSLTTLGGDTGLRIYGKKGSKGVIIIETDKVQVVGNVTKEAVFYSNGLILKRGFRKK